MCPGLLKMMLVEFSKGISLIKTTNKRGPRTDPWGTEHYTGKVLLVELLILTLKVRSVRKSFIKRII